VVHTKISSRVNYLFIIKVKIVLAHLGVTMHLVTHAIVHLAFGLLKVIRVSWTL